MQPSQIDRHIRQSEIIGELVAALTDLVEDSRQRAALIGIKESERTWLRPALAALAKAKGA